jgi:hypothetical protein
MNNDLYGGKYTADEIQRIMQINARPTVLRKPEEAWYRKSATELEPSYKEKRELVHWLINDSNISLQSKEYLKECDTWVPKYQLRGFKYGLVTASATYFLMPVVRRQPFVRRFACSMIPMAYFMRWGYVWGHENWWRRAKEVVVTYEIFSGTRSKFTMK